MVSLCLCGSANPQSETGNAQCGPAHDFLPPITEGDDWILSGTGGVLEVISPHQGFIHHCFTFLSQGCALGYFMTPLRGFERVRNSQGIPDVRVLCSHAAGIGCTAGSHSPFVTPASCQVYGGHPAQNRGRDGGGTDENSRLTCKALP
jgi:hypothetical protein